MMENCPQLVVSVTGTHGSTVSYMGVRLLRYGQFLRGQQNILAKKTFSKCFILITNYLSKHCQINNS